MSPPDSQPPGVKDTRAQTPEHRDEMSEVVRDRNQKALDGTTHQSPDHVKGLDRQVAENLGVAASPPPTEDLDSETDDDVPKQIGPYEIERLLGEGNYGTVYLARDPDMNRLVAIKIPSQAPRKPSERKRFLREARATARIKHINVCQIFHTGEDRGLLYIVMEYIEGGTLKEYMQRGLLPVETTLRIARKLAQGLAAAHEHGVIHRDIKPANVLFDAAKREFLLADFGFARVGLNATVTSPGAGTPAYMSPEQARERVEDLGPHSDVYSLGVMLYEMLSGQVPFSVGSVWEVMRDHCETIPKPLSRNDVPLDPRLNELCLKALEKRPADRYSSADEFEAALSAYLLATAVPTPQRKWSIGAPGRLYIRAEGESAASWTELTVTPGTVDLPEGHTVWLSLSARTTDEDLRALGADASAMPLTRLHLGGCDSITDVGLSYACALMQLRELYLNLCTKVSGEGFSYLSRLENLESLSVRGTQFCDGDVIHLKELRLLKQLDLSHCNISRNASLLCEVQGLERLTLRHCPQIPEEVVRALQKSLRTCMIDTGSDPTTGFDHFVLPDAVPAALLAESENSFDSSPTAELPPAPEVLPTHFVNYDIISLLGEGGFGTVYKAESRSTGEAVAIKAFSANQTKHPILLQRFKHASLVTKMLNHPNVVRAIDYSGAMPHPYLVMEFVDGLSIGQRIQDRGAYPEAEAVRLIGQVCEGLQCAHKQGLIHRDVKPSHLLVDGNGVVKLTGFELVKEVEGDLNLTRTRRGLGTPPFMAPEQFSSARTVDIRADVYSLGVTLYAMVTGVIPFDAKPLDCWRMKMRNEFSPPKQLNLLLSDRANLAICRAMNAEPAQRPASCREFLEELTEQARPSIQNSAKPAAPTDVWYLVYRDEANTPHKVKSSTAGIRNALRDRLLGDPTGIVVSRTKGGNFVPLSSTPEFRDLVVTQTLKSFQIGCPSCQTQFEANPVGRERLKCPQCQYDGEMFGRL